MPDLHDQICSEEGREDDRDFDELLADASNTQLRTALEYAYTKLNEVQKEQTRIYLTS
jgi:hypothetical protein